MDTLVTINVVSPSQDGAEKAMNAALSEVEKLEKLFSFFSADSEVSLVNKNAGVAGVKVSPEIIYILDRAIIVSKNTHGAFDITIGPVIMLYDFYKEIRPGERAIKKNLPLVNYKDIVINRDDSTVFLKKKGMLIDLGGIAKGYAADRVVDSLKKHGIKAGLVSVAGDIRTFGNKPDGRPWKIGIRNPRAKGAEDDIMAIIELSDMAISTSGDYERYFVQDGKRYHHLLNPKTGYPAEGCQSVSVIAGESTFSDAFATGIFILGPEKGLKVLAAMGFDGVIVDSRGKIHITANIRGKIEFKRNP